MIIADLPCLEYLGQKILGRGKRSYSYSTASVGSYSGSFDVSTIIGKYRGGLNTSTFTSKHGDGFNVSAVTGTSFYTEDGSASAHSFAKAQVYSY